MWSYKQLPINFEYLSLCLIFTFLLPFGNSKMPKSLQRQGSVINSGKPPTIITSDISSARPITHLFHLLSLFHSSWIVCSIFFFIPFSPCIAVWEVPVDISSGSWLFPWLSTGHQFTGEPTKVIIFVTMLLISSISFWFLSFTIPAYIIHLFLHVVYFFH